MDMPDNIFDSQVSCANKQLLVYAKNAVMLINYHLFAKEVLFIFTAEIVIYNTLHIHERRVRIE